MRIDRLGDLGSAPKVLRAVAAAAQRRGLPPPAALIGEWFGSRAVIAPSLSVSDRSARARCSTFRLASRAPTPSAAAGSGTCPTPMPVPTDVPARSPKRQAAGPTACCGRTVTGTGGTKAFPAQHFPGWVEEALRNPSPASDFGISWGDADREAHRRGVLDCLEAIAAGEIYQACVCTQFAGALDGAPIDFFVDAVERTSPARAAYLAGDWGAVASLCPELFLRRVGDAVTSSPIKGTLPRSADPAALRASVKDVAENIMIVDLVRNDLGRVATTGSVTVPELLAVRPAPGVWHLVSTVSARVPVDVPMASTARRDVPAGVGHRHAEDAGPSAVGAAGSRIGAGCTAAQSVWHRRLPEANSTWRSGPWSSTQTAQRCSASAAASQPIPTRTANGTSACTRRRRSSALGIAPAALEEQFGQQCRLADHQVVAGVHRQHGLHTAKGGDRPALRCHREGTVAQRQDPGPRHLIG